MSVKYSVLFPLYIKDNTEWMKIAVSSIINQTARPSEIVFVHDGPLSEELWRCLKKYKTDYPDLIKIVGFDQNVGLGKALAFGIEQCQYELIARMDADDFSMPMRCEKQLKILEQNPHLDVIGTNVVEFSGDIEHVVAHVVLPNNHEEIVEFARRRCPIRHPALMYRKAAVMNAGNYHDFRHCQDYDLVVRLILSNAKFMNIQEELVYMRVNADFYARRGGLKQAKITWRLKKGFYDMGFYTLKDLLVSGVGNICICMVPNRLRKIVYKHFLRK